MIPRNQVIEPLEQIVALVLGHVVDVSDVGADGEDGLPACDGVGADDGVDRLQLGADVLGGAAGLFVEFEARAFGDLAKVDLGEGRGEGFEEFLVGWAEAVVDFVTGSPECI